MPDVTTFKMVALAVEHVLEHGLPEDHETLESLVLAYGRAFPDEVTPESVARVMNATPLELVQGFYAAIE